jgi:hypothetical protein
MIAARDGRAVCTEYKRQLMLKELIFSVGFLWGLVLVRSSAENVGFDGLSVFYNTGA